MPLLIVNRKRWAGSPVDVYVGRPSPLGNRWSHRPGTLAEFRVRTRKEAIERYRQWLDEKVAEQDPEVMAALLAIEPDDVLTCWCLPAECHATVIAQMLQRLRGYSYTLDH